MPAGDADRPEQPDGDKAGDGAANEGHDAKEAVDGKLPPKTPRGSKAKPPSLAPQASPRDQLTCAAKRVKERHVSLRVKNLRFLSNLNEEALKMQARLRSLLERSSGALLPTVSVLQKGRIFDLVSQLLDHAVAECARVLGTSTGSGVAPGRIMERAFAFALALEHGSVIAMPADSRTQALKLAALIDSDLLCQILEGPFKRRLLGLGAAKRIVAGGRRQQVRGPLDSASGLKGIAPGSSQAWDDAVNACCGRVIEGLRCLSFLTQKQEATAVPDPWSSNPQASPQA
jgi:hypothetical protein